MQRKLSVDGDDDGYYYYSNINMVLEFLLGDFMELLYVASRTQYEGVAFASSAWQWES